MTMMIRNFNPHAAQLLQGGHQVARAYGASNVGAIHLMKWDLQADNSILGSTLDEASRIYLEDGLEPVLVRYSRANQIELKKCLFEADDQLEEVLQALQIGHANPNGAHNFCREGEVSAVELMAAVLDVRPHAAAQLLRQLKLSSQRLPSPILFNANRVTACQSDGLELLDGVLTDLTELARQNRLGTLVPRDNELDQIMRVLLRKKSSNPVLVGGANVGKTAIVEALSQRIVQGRVPLDLKDCRILQVDLCRLVAGTKYRGEFESRLVKVMAVLKSSRKIIAFMDEIHLLMGLGQTEGTMDASNILKPALARGEIRCIGATTHDEFQALKADPALERRIREVTVAPMSPAATMQLLHTVKTDYEQHHGVEFSTYALDAIVPTALRVWPQRQLPGGAIDFLDELGAWAAMTKSNPGEPPLKIEVDMVKRLGTIL